MRRIVILTKTNLFYFIFILFCVLRNLYLPQGQEGIFYFLLLLEAVWFWLLCFSLGPSEVIFLPVVCSRDRGSFLSIDLPSVPTPFVEKTWHSPMNFLGNFVKKQLNMYVWVLYSVPLIYLFIYPGQLPTLFTAVAS